MRRFALTMAIVSACLGALGQGKVLFGNDSNHLFVLYGNPLPESPFLPDGKILMAVLYAGVVGSLSLQTSVVLGGTGWLSPGRMANKPVILTNVPGGAPAYFQIFVTDPNHYEVNGVDDWGRRQRVQRIGTTAVFRSGGSSE